MIAMRWRRRDRSDVEPLIPVDERPIQASSTSWSEPPQITFSLGEVERIQAQWRARTKRLGRDYGRASATIHALRAENALLREDRAALVEQMPDPWSEPTDVVGGGDAVDLGAAPKAGATTPDDYLLAEQTIAAVERLARDLCAVDMPDTDWGVDEARFKDRYRALAWTAVATRWRPPAVLAEPTRVATVARVLADHEWMADDTCRCGWGCDRTPLVPYPAGPIDRGNDPERSNAAMWHAEHVAQQLLGTGVIA